MLGNALVENLSKLHSINFMLAIAKFETREGKLNKIARAKLHKIFTKCIKHHKRAGIWSIAQQDEGAAQLEESKMTSLYPNLKTVNIKRRHYFCPPQSWCAHKKGFEVGEKAYHLDGCFKKLLLSLYKRYTSHPMLNKLFASFTTNDLKTFNFIMEQVSSMERSG